MSQQSPECGFEGNPDLYGLGIRMGVYFQWVSALIIWRWYPEGRKELGGAYLVFLFALLIAMIVITARLEPTHSAEILLLLYIIFGGIFTVMTLGFRKSHMEKIRKMKGSSVQALTLFFILAAACIYSSWFWLSGIHHDFLETACGTYGFLFTKVSLKNKHVTKFLAALSVYLGIIYGGMSMCILVFFVLFLLRVPSAVRIVRKYQSNPRKDSDSRRQARSSSPSGAQVTQNRRNVMMSIIMPTANVVSLIYSVIGIEMTLQWNHVTGVYTINSVEQLIPFVIGLAGFVKVIYEPLKDWNKSRKQEAGSVDGNDGDFDNEKIAVLEEEQRQEVGDVEKEAATVNHRLRYLDLIKPVEEVTVRKWQEDAFKRRKREPLDRSL